MGILIIIITLSSIIVGSYLPKEKIMMRNVYLKASPVEVFQLITDNTKWDWRSNVNEIITLDDDQTRIGAEFIVKTKSDKKVYFRIEKYIPNSRYELAMSNNGFKGYWKGYLIPFKTGTKLTITSKTRITNPITRLFSYFFLNFNDTIDCYASDMKKELGELKI